MTGLKQRQISKAAALWSQEEYQMAIWAYDRLDLERAWTEDQACSELVERLGRNQKEVRVVLRSIASFDLRPAKMKPIMEDPEVRGKLRLYFSEYWQDREASRQTIQDRYLGSSKGMTRSLQPKQALKALAAPPQGPAIPPPPPLVQELSQFNPNAWGSWEPPHSAAAKGAPTVRGALHQAQKRIDALKALPLQFKATWASQPFPEEALNPLADALREVERRTSRMKTPQPPDPLAFQKAKAKWKASKSGAMALDRRGIRCLCQHPETALTPGWVLFLAEMKEVEIRRTWVEFLLGHYLAHWRTMAHPEALESALRLLLDRLPKEGPWTEAIRGEAGSLVGPDVPQRLVADLPDPLRGWEELLARWDLSREVGLGQGIILEALRVWEGSNKAPRQHRPLEQIVEDLCEGFRGLLREPCIPEERFYSVVSTLVLDESARTHAEIRESMLEEVLAHPRLGDPRVKKHHWHAMPMARDRVISWMARKNLRWFYDSVVSDDSDDQGRKAFWLQYVDQVTEFRLVLGDEDRCRLEEAQGEENFQYASMEGNKKVSAFILRFSSVDIEEDLVCVEFSRTGHKVFIYLATSFEAGVGHLDAHSFRIGSEPRNLKSDEYKDFKKAHIGYWQYDVARYLKNHGIVPL